MVVVTAPLMAMPTKLPGLSYRMEKNMATNSPVAATSEATMRGQISTKRATLDGNSVAGVPASINRSQFWIGRPSRLIIAKAPANITTLAMPKVTMSPVSSERTATPPTGSGSITEKYRKMISPPKKFAPKSSATSLREMSREDGWEVVMVSILLSVKGVDFTKLALPFLWGNPNQE